MKRLVLVLSIAIASPHGVATQAGGIQRVAWLHGCWEMTSGDRVVEEHWLAPRGTNMMGIGRTVRGAQLVEYELLILREQDGRLAYEAHPSGQAPATFLSTSVTDSSVVFENPQHDFPQRIGYERKGPNTLLAWIEGPRGGQVRRIEYPYTRAVCDAK